MFFGVYSVDLIVDLPKIGSVIVEVQSSATKYFRCGRPSVKEMVRTRILSQMPTYKMISIEFVEDSPADRIENTEGHSVVYVTNETTDSEKIEALRSIFAHQFNI